MAEWWKTDIFYIIYIRSFKDSNDDGIGDLTGVIGKLEYLRFTLGVDVIWLVGLLDSPWLEYGFDVSNHTGVHPAFGTIGTFDELVRRAHAIGLKVLIDYIPNHTSDQHVWFIEAASSRESSKRDWYLWRDPRPDGTPPNNWLSLFGGPSWEWHERTWQYYHHTFLKEQPDLNWRNPEVEAAMLDVARFWLERGVDGFRIDAAQHIMKDPGLADNPPAEPRIIRGLKLAHEYQQHQHDREHPDLHRVWKDFRRLLDSYSQDTQRIAVAEVHTQHGWQEWARYFGENLDECHFPLNPGFISLKWEAREVRRIIDEVEAALPPGAWPNQHTGNYDEVRVATRYGRPQARVAGMLLLTMRGTPILYFGEEIGMGNAPIPPEYESDAYGLRLGLGRDPQRSPMQWDPGPHAGFASHTVQRLWLPISPDYRQVNVETELSRPDSILNLYRRLIAVRKASGALTLGSYAPRDDAPEDCVVYLREHAGERVLVALSFAADARQVALPDLGYGELLASTHLDREGQVALADLNLRPHEGVVVKLA